MQEYQIRILENYPELTDELFNKITKAGLLTGSKVFGGYKFGSDNDYIMMYDEKLIRELRPYSFYSEGSMTNSSTLFTFYVRYKGDYINVIVTKLEEDYDSWVRTHNLVIDMINGCYEFEVMMREKKFRVAQFQLIREHFGWTQDNPFQAVTSINVT